MKRLFTAAAAVMVLFVLAQAAHARFYEVPVLMYHMVDETSKESGNIVSPENFEKQMEFLKLHRYRVVPLETLIAELKSGKPVPFKTTAITFDDGTLDNFRHAFPVLRKMGFPATIFMITSNIGKPGWLSAEDLRILDESNIAIGSHTVNHAFLPELPLEEARVEITHSKRVLESVLGHEVRLFSYPAGGVNPALKRLVQEVGYVGAVTTNYGPMRNDPYMLHRVKVGISSKNLFAFWLKASGFYRIGKKNVSHAGSEPWTASRAS